MIPRTVLAAIIAVAATGAFPTESLAQPADTGLERKCNDFAWLLGSWTSYSPYGDHSDPTDGTLVFTMAADGSVEGRLTSLNPYAEEHGYREGMVVFRGFREVYHYGPDGTTRHESRDGEFYVLDVTARHDPDQQRGYWEGGMLGEVTASGYLYLNPVGRGHLSNYGEWRKLPAATQQRVADACGAGESVAAADDGNGPDDGTYPDYADWRSLLNRTKLDPPVLLSPLAPPTDECLQVIEGREENPSNILTRHRNTQDQLDQLAGYGQLLGQPDLDPESRASHARSYLRVLKDVLDDYHALHAARLIEQDAARRQTFAEKISAIEAQVQIGDATRRFLQDWDAGKPLPDDVFEQIESVSLNPTFDRDLPEPQMDTLTAEQIRLEYQCMLPPLVVADPLVPSESELDVHSVRSEQPAGLYPQRQDVQTLLDQVRRTDEAIREMDLQDPVLPALERLYSQNHRKLRIQQIGFANLALDDNASQADRDRYAQQARDIGRVLDELPEPAPPPITNFGGFDISEAVIPGPESDPDLVELYGDSDLQDLMQRIGNGSANAASADAFLASPQSNELRNWLRDNDLNMEAVEYDEAEGYLRITPYKAGLPVDID